MKILWLDNYSPEEYKGGAELTGKYLRDKAIEQGHRVLCLHANTQEMGKKVSEFVEDSQIDITVLGNVDKFPKDMLQRLIISEIPYIVIHNNSLDIPEAVPNMYASAKLIVLLEPKHCEHIKLPIPDSIVYPPYVDTKIFYDYKLPRNGKACYIGLITEHKGVAQTITECVKQGIKIDLYGKTDNPSYLELLKTMEGVRYCGELDTPEDVATVMNTYTYFAWVLNRYGCYGRTLVEAILCGDKLIVNSENFGLFNFPWDFDNPEDVKLSLQEAHETFWDTIETKLTA